MQSATLPPALGTADTQNNIETHKFCTFWLSGRLFGVSILDVKEIHPDISFTPIFHAPAVVKGYVNIRGQIHLILDLRKMLGFDSKEIDRKSCLVIFKHSVAEPFGVLVDQIGDVVEVAANQMEKGGLTDAGIEQAGNSPIVQWICKLEKDLLVVLNAKRILKSIEI